MTDDLARLRQEIASLVDSRDEFIKTSGLDERFCYPDGNWGPSAANDFRRKYELLRDAQVPADVIRPLSENFTGYQFPADETFGVANRYCVDRWKTSNGIGEPSGSNQQPSSYLYRPLSLPGERGPTIEGVIVNEDTCTYQGYLNQMVGEGIVDRLKNQSRPVIVEIGAGYGALALALLQILGDDVLYVICDLPESLLFSGLYLTMAGKHVRTIGKPFSDESGVLLVPNYFFMSLATQVDLAINTLSMSEMSEHQVRVFAEGISRLIGTRGVFFEHNYDNHHLPMMINCKAYLPEYFAQRRSIGGRGLCDLWSNEE